MSDDYVASPDVIQAYEKLENYIMHYGTPRKSGRYPYGSGENAYQRNRDFLAYADKLAKEGLTQAELAKALGFKSSTEYRAARTIAVTAKRQEEIDQIRKMHDKGMSNVAIGERLGIRESTVRSRLNPALKERANRYEQTAEFFKGKVDEAGFIDVGTGVENILGMSVEQKKVAIKMLEQEGYKVFYKKTPQPGTDKETNIMVLARPDKTFKDLADDPNQIQPVTGYSEDLGHTFREIKPPQSISSSRVGIRYADEGGSDKDGVVELRRGVDDISLGDNKYAQVRIAVDGTHYIKGMAMYSDNLPDGVDMVFNTNKKSTGNKLDALKGIKDDPELPFGSITRQKHYIDKDGKEKLSPLNIVNEEGEWHEWSATLSSQMLSKQSPSFAKQQLDLTYRTKRDDLDEILSLTNVEVKRKLLEEYADGADSSSVHLKAAGLPRTRQQVILPINSLKDNEVYAPNFRNGETVVLIRHPHGGKFEIPELKVNNRNKEALSVIKQARDAVGINSKVAAQLSGADFDGDSVLVIPNNSGKIKSQSPLGQLKNFDPQDYKIPKGSNIPPMKGKQKQMGDISNLITDMTIRGASDAELARAVKHSMVIIDAEKHNLDWRRSKADNGIQELKLKYQAKPDGTAGGASTLISRAKSQERVGQRKPRSAKDGGPIDPKTGEKMYEYTGETYTETKVNKRTGEVTTRVIPRTQLSTKMAEARDAHTLVSRDGGTPIERVYADHANKLKALANEARREAVKLEPIKMNASAKKTYSKEVESLKAKLNVAKSNAPLERKAILVANAAIAQRRKSNPNLEASQVKKIKGQELTKARARLNAKKEAVTFTPREWEAVQAGAISSNVLRTLLQNANPDQIKELSMPRTKPALTSNKTARVRAMYASGYTQAEIADALGVSTGTIADALN